MPFDPRVRQALSGATRSMAPYRSTVSVMRDEIRAALAHSADDVQAQRLASQLGPFASNRIDATRLASVLTDRSPLDEASRTQLERAAAALNDLAGLREEAFVVDVPENGDLAATIRERLAVLGRAFAAGRDGASWAFPFARWTKAERMIAPPLIVTVRGGDLRTGALAEFLDGAQKILLIVDGDAPPAPLVRLITPAVFVIQAHDPSELERFWDWPRAGIGAVLPASTARFTHDPAAGQALWQRMTVTSLPAAPKTAVAGFSATQLLEELRQLEALAARPPVQHESPARVAAENTPAVDPVDRLAAWLLQQAVGSD